MLYVGGLDPTVTEALIRAAFIPFGEVKEVTLPPDPESSEPGQSFIPRQLPPSSFCCQFVSLWEAGCPATLCSPPFPAAGHRGFAFVLFEDEEDAVEAKFNMNGAELRGRVLRVDDARPGQGGATGPAWQAADKWYADMGVSATSSSSSMAAASTLRQGPSAGLSKAEEE